MNIKILFNRDELNFNNVNYDLLVANANEVGGLLVTSFVF